MAEMMRKFFEMNDMDVLVVAVLYFTSVIGGWIYCCKKWRKDDEERVYKAKNDTYGRGTVKTAQNVTDRKRSKDFRNGKKVRGKNRG